MQNHVAKISPSQRWRVGILVPRRRRLSAMPERDLQSETASWRAHSCAKHKHAAAASSTWCSDGTRSSGFVDSSALQTSAERRPLAIPNPGTSESFLWSTRRKGQLQENHSLRWNNVVEDSVDAELPVQYRRRGAWSSFLYLPALSHPSWHRIFDVRTLRERFRHR